MKAPWLLVDAGNSRIKWALAPATPPADWHAAAPTFLAAGAVDHADWQNLAGDIRTHWSALWSTLDDTAQAGETTGFVCPPPAGVWLSNVAGDAAEQAVRMTLQTLWGMASDDWLQVLRASEERAGVRNSYDTPSQLGSDRWATLIGAHAAWPGEHLLIVTLGTATTVEALHADGSFLGGLIAPGPALMLQSLAQGTAQLPSVDAITPPHGDGFSRNTRDALVSGCLGAQAGLVERSHTELQQRLGASVRCVLSGGARQWLASALTIPHTEHDRLVLAGLYEVAIGDVMPNASGTATAGVDNTGTKTAGIRGAQ